MRSLVRDCPETRDNEIKWTPPLTRSIRVADGGESRTAEAVVRAGANGYTSGSATRLGGDCGTDGDRSFEVPGLGFGGNGLRAWGGFGFFGADGVGGGAERTKEAEAGFQLVGLTHSTANM